METLKRANWAAVAAVLLFCVALVLAIIDQQGVALICAAGGISASILALGPYLGAEKR